MSYRAQISKRIAVIGIMGATFQGLACKVPPSRHVEEYANSSSTQFAYAIRELPRIPFMGTEKVLDVGSGSGSITKFIAQYCVPWGSVLGVDIDAGMISYARTQAGGVSNVSFDCVALSDFTGTDFDVIVSFWCLHWVKQYGDYLQQMADMLTSQGKMLLCHAVNNDPLEDSIVKTLNTPRWRRHVALYQPSLHILSEAAVRAAVTSAGLAPVVFELRRNSAWVSMDLFQKNILSLPMFTYIPENERSAFCADVISAYCTDNPLNEHGEIEYWLPVVIMVLQKQPLCFF